MEQSQYLQLPSKPGVYLFKNKEKEIIYIGKAKDLKKRVSSYFRKGKNIYINHDLKTTKLASEIKYINHIVVSSELEAFLLEAQLIKKYLPYYNIKMADDKSYPYIMVSMDKVPYVCITRKKNLKNAKYFGPYADSSSVKIVLKLLRKIFPYQSVKNHYKRKCLYFHLGLCPCIPALPGNLKKYKNNINKLTRFLEGKYLKVLDSLYKEQKKCIKKEEFEEAEKIQKQINSIKIITQETYNPFRFIEKPQIQKEREKKENKALLNLLKKEGLKINKLERIECYDISNIQGSLATGSMVVFIKGEAAKNLYKKFRIKKTFSPNDYNMHQEVIQRRLLHPQWGMPDLIIVDGGKGQVSSVMQVLASKNISIPVIGLAKRFETIIIPQKIGNKFEFTELKLYLSDSSLNLLRRIRDEAHRFAITYHKLLRSKKMIQI